MVADIIDWDLVEIRKASVALLVDLAKSTEEGASVDWTINCIITMHGIGWGGHESSPRDATEFNGADHMADGPMSADVIDSNCDALDEPETGRDCVLNMASVACLFDKGTTLPDYEHAPGPDAIASSLLDH